MRKTKEATAAYMRELRASRKEQGLCNMCSEPAVSGRTRCEKHLAYFRDRRKTHPRCSDQENIALQQKRDKLAASGLCTWCKCPLENSKSRVCKICRTRDQETTRAKWKQRLEHGLCKWCGKQDISDKESQVCADCHCKLIARNNLKEVGRWRELKALHDRQNVCPYTGRLLVLGVNASLDHVVPRSAGGSDEIDNLRWVYGGDDFDVNMMKGKASESDFLEAVKHIYENAIFYKN